MEPDYDCSAESQPPTCLLQATEEECVATHVDGQKCGWCFSSSFGGVGHCMGPGLAEGFDCKAPPAPKPESPRTRWLVPVVSVASVSLVSLVAVIMYVQRRRRSAT